MASFYTIPPLSSTLFSPRNEVDGIDGAIQSASVAGRNTEFAIETLPSLQGKVLKNTAAEQQLEASIENTQKVIASENNPKAKEAAQSLLNTLEEQKRILGQQTEKIFSVMQKLLENFRKVREIVDEVKTKGIEHLTSQVDLSPREAFKIASELNLYKDPLASYLGIG